VCVCVCGVERECPQRGYSLLSCVCVCACVCEWSQCGYSLLSCVCVRVCVCVSTAWLLFVELPSLVVS